MIAQGEYHLITGVPFPWRWVAIEARFPVQGHEALSLEAPLETLYPVYS